MKRYLPLLIVGCSLFGLLGIMSCAKHGGSPHSDNVKPNPPKPTPPKPGEHSFAYHLEDQQVDRDAKQKVFGLQDEIRLVPSHDADPSLKFSVSENDKNQLAYFGLTLDPDTGAISGTLPDIKFTKPDTSVIVSVIAHYSDGQQLKAPVTFNIVHNISYVMQKSYLSGEVIVVPIFNSKDQPDKFKIPAYDDCIIPFPIDQNGIVHSVLNENTNKFKTQNCSEKITITYADSSVDKSLNFHTMYRKFSYLEQTAKSIPSNSVDSYMVMTPTIANPKDVAHSEFTYSTPEDEKKFKQFGLSLDPTTGEISGVLTYDVKPLPKPLYFSGNVKVTYFETGSFTPPAPVPTAPVSYEATVFFEVKDK